MRRLFRSSCLLGALIVPIVGNTSPKVKPDPLVAKYKVPHSQEPQLSRSKLLKLLRGKVKYLFVLYQENRSFDSYFGTYPGADGLYSQSARKTPGFREKLLNTKGQIFYVSPFRIGRKQDAQDLGSVGHSHPLTLAKLHIVNGKPQMDRFALAEERDHMHGAEVPTLRAMQYGELEMAHEDGSTIPFLWRYADRFVLCDHIFEEMAADSTPGNLSIIAAQTGITQWIRHPSLAFKGNGGSGPGLPVVNDSNPFWGSPLDKTVSGKMPYNPKDYKKEEKNPRKIQNNLTFATLMLTLSGKALPEEVTHDRAPSTDLADIQHDIQAIGAKENRTLNWGWYEEGFDREPASNDAGPVDADGLHVSYVTHHNGPQYFGYISNNPSMASHLHGLGDFYKAVDSSSLPGPGVYYVKGGKLNIMGLKPLNPVLNMDGKFLGDDDHPGDSDSDISEAMLARTINAIAKSKYWAHCAIVITWDDAEGDYDHVPPHLLNIGPDGKPLSEGPRIPLLLISPYARTHTVDSATGCTASVVKLVDNLFDTIPLANLPDEMQARKEGLLKYHSANMGPLDADTPGITGLLSAFDPARLAGRAAALPASYAEIPDALVDSLKAQESLGWQWTGVEPVDIARGIVTYLPPHFNPRPGQPASYSGK